MEHQSHSNDNTAPDHQTFTTSANTPSFRVYVDMGTEQYANGSVVYTSQEDQDRMCVDSLKDGAHYRFQCRCGCGAQFAGFGKDIKAAAKIGGTFKPVPVVTKTDGGTTITTIDAEPRKLNTRWTAGPDVELTARDKQYMDWVAERANKDVVLNDNASAVTGVSASAIIGALNELAVDGRGDADVVESPQREEAAEKPRPYVSDRYLKKAQFGLSDDEIDAYHANRPDPLESRGVKLSERQPPAIGDVVYSLSTNDGPYTVLDYANRDVKVSNEGDIRATVLCALLRTTKGDYKSLPLADLAVDYEDRPVKKSESSIWPILMAVTSGLLGSGLALSYFALRATTF